MADPQQPPEPPAGPYDAVMYRFAAEQLRKGTFPAEIETQLVAQGLDVDAATTLVTNLVKTSAKAKEVAKRTMVYGALWCIGGILLSVESYVLALVRILSQEPGGAIFYIAYGAIGYGAVEVIRGLGQLVGAPSLAVPAARGRLFGISTRAQDFWRGVLWLVRSLAGLETFWRWVWWLVCHRTTRYVVSWLFCIGILIVQFYSALDVFRDNRRPAQDLGFGLRSEGGSGHGTIDFGGQWLMGAMLVEGHGQELYNRYSERALLEKAFPVADEVPPNLRSKEEKDKHDAAELMGWMMGSDDKQQGAVIISSLASPLAAQNGLGGAVLLAVGQDQWSPDKVKSAAWPVGGPLYPPINAFYMAPLGLLPPTLAYRLNQVLCLVWALGIGLGMSYMSRGRFWWPLATALVLGYPGFKGALHLGQNAPLTLFFAVWGWALLTRGHPWLGGIVWGLLAFKPVWAATLFLVPLVTGRFRFCFAMLATGTALAAATIPLVGLHSWMDWLRVGQEAAKLYDVDVNWVYLSRDLLGIPRRWLLNFDLPNDQRDRPLARLLGWGMWAFVLETTLLLTALRWRQARACTGAAPAFLLLATWMCCYHFMYYDVLLSLLPFFLLCTEPRDFLKPIMIAILPLRREQLPSDLATYYGTHLPTEYPSDLPPLKAEHRHVLVLNRMVPTVLLVLLIIEHAFNMLGMAVIVTGYWSDESPFPVTISWMAIGGHQITTNGEYTPHAFRLKIPSYIYVSGQPWDTYTLLFLWMWCGVVWIRQGGKVLAPLPLPVDNTADVILVPALEVPHAIHPA